MSGLIKAFADFGFNNIHLFIWILAPAYMTFFGSVYSVFLFVIIIKVISFFNRVKI